VKDAATLSMNALADVHTVVKQHTANVAVEETLPLAAETLQNLS